MITVYSKSHKGKDKVALSMPQRQRGVAEEECNSFLTSDVLPLERKPVLSEWEAWWALELLQMLWR